MKSSNVVSHPTIGRWTSKRVRTEYEGHINAHREKIGELLLQIYVFKKSQGSALRGRELVWRVRSMLEAEGKRVSLWKIAKWIGVSWSTMQYKPRRRSTPPVDKNVDLSMGMKK